jgi:hypothetical protein
MIVVIQCSGTRRADAGFLETKDGRPVWFVAKPGMGPRDEKRVYDATGRPFRLGHVIERILLNDTRLRGEPTRRMSALKHFRLVVLQRSARPTRFPDDEQKSLETASSRAPGRFASGGFGYARAASQARGAAAKAEAQNP